MSLKTPKTRKSIDLKDAENHFKACYEISRRGINEIKLSEFNNLLNRTIIVKNILVSKFEQLYPKRNVYKPNDVKLGKEIRNIFDEYYPSYKEPHKRMPTIIYRQVYFYLIRKHTSITFTKIGKELDLDHSSVVHSKNIVLVEIEMGNKAYTDIIYFVEEKLRNINYYETSDKL